MTDSLAEDAKDLQPEEVVPIEPNDNTFVQPGSEHDDVFDPPPEKASSDEVVMDLEDPFPNAKHLGPYWDTPQFEPVIKFEAALVRFLRGLVDQGRLTLGDLPRVIDEARSRTSHAEKALHRPYNDPPVLLLDFIEKAQWRFGEPTLRQFGDEILARAKRWSMESRKLWDDQSYWPPENAPKKKENPCDTGFQPIQTR